jgi:hypothetical protein
MLNPNKYKKEGGEKNIDDSTKFITSKITFIYLNFLIRLLGKQMRIFVMHSLFQFPRSFLW